MTVNERELRDVWRTQQPRDAQRPDCLTDQDWPRLMAGEMSTAERIRAATHLTTCAACADEYRSLFALRPWADDAARALSPKTSRPARRWLVGASQHRAARALAAAVCIVIAQAVALVWILSDRRGEIARLETRIVSHEQESASARSALAELHARRRAASSAAGGEVAELRERVAQLSTLQLDVPILDLDPSGETRGADREPAATVDVPREARFVVLILNFAPLSERSTLVVRVSGESSREIQNARTVREAGVASLNLTLERQRIPDGRYVLHLAAERHGRPETIAQYGVRIRSLGERPR